jgi:MOSC domain-containing protein YiiM
MICGRVAAIYISRSKGSKKESINKGFFLEGHGLEGDVRSGKGPRQVSLLAQESKRRMKTSEIKGFCNGKFSENITVEGLRLHTLTVGQKLKIGESIQEIIQIGKECHDGCPIKEHSGQCIVTKDGVFARVLQSGSIKVGDEVSVIDS